MVATGRLRPIAPRQESRGLASGCQLRRTEALGEGAEAVPIPAVKPRTSLRDVSKPILVEIGAGELIDKITILRIKSERMTDAAKLVNVRRELDVLSATRDASLSVSVELSALESALKAINEALWQIEDDIRACEAGRDFGPRFIELARAVYTSNDRRAAIKKDINLLSGSSLVEEKSYRDTR